MPRANPAARLQAAPSSVAHFLATLGNIIGMRAAPAGYPRRPIGHSRAVSLAPSVFLACAPLPAPPSGAPCGASPRPPFAALRRSARGVPAFRGAKWRPCLCSAPRMRSKALAGVGAPRLLGRSSAPWGGAGALRSVGRLVCLAARPPSLLGAWRPRAVSGHFRR